MWDFLNYNHYMNHEFRPSLLQLIALYKLTKEKFTKKSLQLWMKSKS
jgi:hypothetical protein